MCLSGLHRVSAGAVPAAGWTRAGRSACRTWALGGGGREASGPCHAALSTGRGGVFSEPSDPRGRARTLPLAFRALGTSAEFPLPEASRARHRHAARPPEGRRTVGIFRSQREARCPSSLRPPRSAEQPRRHRLPAPGPGATPRRPAGPALSLGRVIALSHRDTSAAPTRGLPGACLQRVFQKASSPRGSPCCRKAVGKSVKYLPLPRDLHVHPQALPEGHCPCH